MPDDAPPAGPSPEPADAEAIVQAVEAGTDGIHVPEELLVEPEETKVRPAEAQSLYARILAMGTGEKIKLALRGNKDVRLILARDPARLVRRLVLMNPRITDAEVIAVARNRSADEELLRLITQKREWMRNYQVRLALVTNPKTPLAISMRQLPTLGERDIRALAKSKNVPQAVATQARRMIASRQLPGGSGE
ncbi:MAG TPA: hypothetical protein VFD84_02275 [Candidatus Binatia bacterium]|nr:hypothetical protein [Candidatus Binatia bacterium]